MRTVILIYEEIPENSKVYLFRHISEDEYNKLLSFNNIFVGRQWHPNMGLTKEDYDAKTKEVFEYFFDGDKFRLENEEVETPVRDFHVDALIRTGYLVS